MPLRPTDPTALAREWPISEAPRAAVGCDEAETLPVASKATPDRGEPRERVVHVVEYSRYPRRIAEESRRIAYTQDRSATGLGLDLPEPLDPGELVRVTLRDIDGRIDMDGLARVVWCHPQDSGRARAGVAMLREKGERPLMRVRADRAGALALRRAANTRSPRVARR